MLINRVLGDSIASKLFKGKTIVLIGPRQTGKTTIIKKVIKKYDKVVFLDGDDVSVRQMLENANTEILKRIIGENIIIFIDEAQRIDRIGLTAKIINDQFPKVQLILSGSSALELNNAINEPLTGRKWQYQMFPISWGEFQNEYGFLKASQQLNDRLVYGMYPDVITSQGEEKDVLKTLTNSYLYRDVLALGNVKKPEVLERLLKALAYQVGSEVSYNELAQLLGINKETVSRYIELLEKTFIVFRITPFSRNLRNEIKRKSKIYFYDNGIRNAIISAYNDIDLRSDKGALWENFLVSERIKLINNHQHYVNYYFWRTKQQQEVDWVEEENMEIKGYEFKWNKKPNQKTQKKFEELYKTKISIIDRENFYDFVMEV